MKLVAINHCMGGWVILPSFYSLKCKESCLNRR
nr:MAG TPA: Protein of unknown function (DUF452) [Siphoviridae sp. ctDlU28]